VRGSTAHHPEPDKVTAGDTWSAISGELQTGFVTGEQGQKAMYDPDRTPSPRAVHE